jgi:hypothetical protein
LSAGNRHKAATRDAPAHATVYRRDTAAHNPVVVASER